LLKQYAGFVDATYSLTQSLQFSAGVRKAWLNYSGWEAIEQPPPFDANSAFSFVEKEEPTTPRFVAKYSFDDSNMVYASASKGFRIGGSNAPATGVCEGDAKTLGLPVGVPTHYGATSSD
jgi:outer membrane receptor protein involved in Fe transport